ncbi:hypothetical protein GQ44DRAFT_727858 [Phaeosphaeriaceae sp. PMI808]|nr:hypothetical protein GQ44DRAFT_727858 [Phaeosphaeriaceae sp. PMI808]
MSSGQQLDFATLDVFTSKRYEGNPLAIIRVPHGVVVNQDQKQAIAREFNLSESTFLHEKDPDTQHDVWTVDIFLTTDEIPFAGHPTIGTACYVLSRMAEERRIQDGVIEANFNLKAGPVGLWYDVAKKTARAAIPQDVFVRHHIRWSRAAFLELQPKLVEAHNQRGISVQDDFAIVSIVKGMTFVLVELENLESLQVVELFGQRLTIVGLDQGWNDTFIGMYVFVRMGKDPNGTIGLRSRMIEGTLEDPATGSAASALAAYLSLTEGTSGGTTRYEVVQGVEIGRRSEIVIDVTLDTDNSVAKIYLEGRAVPVMEGQLSI